MCPTGSLVAVHHIAHGADNVVLNHEDGTPLFSRDPPLFHEVDPISLVSTGCAFSTVS